jgi:preprotein translocase subunit SecG
MLTLFGILIIISSIILGFIVLIQNPKGGGLSGTFGGIGNQFMGVKQSTDVMEKATWIFAAIIGILCMVSPAFIPKDGADGGNDLINKATTTQQSTPSGTNSNTTNLPGTQSGGN